MTPACSSFIGLIHAVLERTIQNCRRFIEMSYFQKIYGFYVINGGPSEHPTDDCRIRRMLTKVGSISVDEIKLKLQQGIDRQSRLNNDIGDRLELRFQIAVCRNLVDHHGAAFERALAIEV